MISLLDSSDHGSGPGVTDPVSGKVLVEMKP